MRLTPESGAAVAAVAIVAAAPASAAQISPEAFAKNIWPNVNFLDESSRLATRKAKSAKLRAFARSEASDQTVIANSITAWMENHAQQPTKDAAEARISSPRSIVAAPFRAAATVTGGVADAIDGVQTGRSVAIETDPPTKTINLKKIHLPNLQENMKRLSQLSGREFDAFYKQCQIDALTQLSTSYANYIESGGDAALLALAVRALPSVNSKLAQVKVLR